MDFKDIKYYSYQRVVDDYRNEVLKGKTTCYLETFPLLVKKDFSGAFTLSDEWVRWLTRMNTYEFSRISFTKVATTTNGEKVEIHCDRVWPNSTNSVFVVNAFTLEQAKEILENNIKLNNYFNEGGVDFFEAEAKTKDIKYINSRTWIGYDSSDEHAPSDCDPRSWIWSPVPVKKSYNKKEVEEKKHENQDFYWYAIILKLSRERGLCSYEEKRGL